MNLIFLIAAGVALGSLLIPLLCAICYVVFGTSAVLYHLPSIIRDGTRILFNGKPIKTVVKTSSSKLDFNPYSEVK